MNGNNASSTDRDRAAPPPKTLQKEKSTKHKVVDEQTTDIIKHKHIFELCDQTGRQVLGCNEGNRVITHLHSLIAQPHAERMKAFSFYYA